LKRRLRPSLQTLEWYQTNYPDGPQKVLGFLDYKLLFALQLDHIYTSAYFLGLSALLTASLIACSKTQQWPLLKMSKRWSFPSRPEQVFAKGNGAQRPARVCSTLCLTDDSLRCCEDSVFHSGPCSVVHAVFHAQCAIHSVPCTHHAQGEVCTHSSSSACASSYP
jgi:hypothetical protein